MTVILEHQSGPRLRGRRPTGRRRRSRRGVAVQVNNTYLFNNQYITNVHDLRSCANRPLRTYGRVAVYVSSSVFVILHNMTDFLP